MSKQAKVFFPRETIVSVWNDARAVVVDGSNWADAVGQGVRMSLRIEDVENNEMAIIMDEAQVRKLRDALTDWLDWLDWLEMREDAT